MASVALVLQLARVVLVVVGGLGIASALTGRPGGTFWASALHGGGRLCPLLTPVQRTPAAE